MYETFFEIFKCYTDVISSCTFSVEKMTCFIKMMKCLSYKELLLFLNQLMFCYPLFKRGTVLSLLSAQGTYVSHFRWALIEMLKNSAKDRYFCKITQYVCLWV